MSGRPTVCCVPASGTCAIADASAVRAARSSGSSEWTLVLPQARANIWHSMVSVCKKYNLMPLLLNALSSGSYISRKEYKKIIVPAVVKMDNERYQISLHFYPTLSDFRQCITSITMWVWWTYAKKKPNMLYPVKILMRLLTTTSCLREHSTRYSPREKMQDMQSAWDWINITPPLQMPVPESQWPPPESLVKGPLHVPPSSYEQHARHEWWGKNNLHPFRNEIGLYWRMARYIYSDCLFR